MSALSQSLQALTTYVVAPFTGSSQDVANAYFASVKDDVQQFGQWYTNALDSLSNFKTISQSADPYV